MLPPIDVTSAWDLGPSPQLEPVHMGNINPTWRVVGPSCTVGFLQRLNTNIFVPQVHHDIAAVTEHIAASGLLTPRLVNTRDGLLWHTTESGDVYRVLTPVGDRSVEKLVDPADAESAGELVARFHAAVSDLEITFQSIRPGAHDTNKHMAALTESLAAHRSHRLYNDVAPLAESLLRAWEAWDGPHTLPSRVIHGDLKISNIRFNGAQATALIDLDTFQHGTLDAELGDAMRSWCNPASEDAERATFSVEIFAAAMRGYARGSVQRPPTEDEWGGIVPGVQRICLELAARFAKDALDESYFGWNRSYGTAGAHNLVRARGQHSLAQAVATARGEAERSLRAARSGA